jgi:hypothetical protein
MVEQFPLQKSIFSQQDAQIMVEGISRSLHQWEVDEYGDIIAEFGHQILEIHRGHDFGASQFLSVQFACADISSCMFHSFSCAEILLLSALVVSLSQATESECEIERNDLPSTSFVGLLLSMGHVMQGKS